MFQRFFQKLLHGYIGLDYGEVTCLIDVKYVVEMRGVDYSSGVMHCPEGMRGPMVDPERFFSLVERAHLF